MRALLDLHPDCVAVKLDIRNAHNKIRRNIVLERLLNSGSLALLAPLFWACYAPPSDIVLSTSGLPMADFFAEEGVQQGDAFATSGSCVGIHPEVCRLDADVAEHGGAARFINDDGYVVGPSAAVFLAVQHFAASMSPLG